jgi:hypothetical protein
MLGVKDAGMMGEGIRAADWRAGTTEATYDMVGEVSFLRMFVKVSKI